jgi:hypothetical protein
MPSEAEERSVHRLGWGLRLGYADPGGNAWRDMPQQDMTGGVVLLQADLSYAFRPTLVGSVFGAIGIGGNGNALSASCEGTGATCHVLLLDIGFAGEFRPLPGAFIQPWVGASLGVDVLTRHAEYGGYSVDANAYGPALSASAGLDIDFGTFRLGPYFDYKLGWYQSVDVSDSLGYSTSSDPEIDHVAMHRWLTIGVRGTHDFGG